MLGIELRLDICKASTVCVILWLWPLLPIFYPLLLPGVPAPTRMPTGVSRKKYCQGGLIGLVTNNSYRLLGKFFFLLYHPKLFLSSTRVQVKGFLTLSRHQLLSSQLPFPLLLYLFFDFLLPRKLSILWSSLWPRLNVVERRVRLSHQP